MMQEKNRDTEIKRSRFPASLFGVYLGVLLLMSGIHTGLLVIANKEQWNEVVQIVIPIVYWSAVAMGLTWFTRKKVRSTYEVPLQNFADATKKVANGDFSVYVPPLHTPDRLDYLDVMILDFNKMVEELGSIETLKTDFVSSVSHEMKTPIAVIKNYAEVLRTGWLTEEKRLTGEERLEYIKIIEEAAAKLSDLIGNILRLNKLENQKMAPEKKEYDVSRQLCECILQYETLWEKKEIQVEAELEESVMLEADESLLELVWNNLFSNAVKFTEKGGTIRVCLETDDTAVRIAVSDTGCGMSQESVRHIFDKFYQGDTSHSREGNGLGLALVWRVLELMDGEIQVTSEVGKGSTFTVILPKKKNGGAK